MKQGTDLSLGQTVAVLDNAPVAIYVSAADDQTLLYANQMARDLFLHNPCKPGATCYQVAGFDRPCPYCRAGEMSRARLLTRQFRDPRDQRVYQLSGKLIDWDGTSAHIEYVLDITDRVREEERSKALQEQLESIFSSIPCGLAVYRFDGGRIVPVTHNQPFYDVMGYSQEHILRLERETEFLGVHPEDVGPLHAVIGEAIASGGSLRHIYRVFNDRAGEYRWICLEGAVKPQPDGTKLLYGVYSDVTQQQGLEAELARANEKMQDIINAIPGGIAIYKVSDIFETVYFSAGVPELTGYTVEEYQELVKRDAAEMTYWEDTAMVVARAMQVIKTHEVAEFEFRKLHRDGHIVWVRAQIKWIGEDDGCPLLHCVFHNISDLKEAQLEMDYLLNSIPGGIASYRVEHGRSIPTFYSDGVTRLTGHTRAEYEEIIRENALDIVYEPDRPRVSAAAQDAIRSGKVLDVSYRMRHKNGSLIWIHLNGRRMGPLADVTGFYAVFTGMSAETRLFQNIANETADGIYVIDKENYDLLYANEAKSLFMIDGRAIGRKCYEALHHKQAPCAFCTLKDHPADGLEHEMKVEGSDRFYSTRFLETDWNGIPAYIKFVRDMTDEVTTRKAKERLEQYFQTVVKYLPGGVAVVRYEQSGAMTPEFLSDGFAQMTGMTLEEAWQLYRKDAMAGVYPDDRKAVNEQMTAYIASGESHCELAYRLKKGRGDGYVWVKNTLSMIQNEGGESRVYAVYRDITKEREEQERLRLQYKDLLLQHYSAPAPNTLMMGHCNITQNRILEIINSTEFDPLNAFGYVREEFFTGVAGLVVEEAEREAFLNIYLNAPALAAYARKETEQIMDCFIQIPGEAHGRYARFKMNLVETPDTGDVTGILTVTDITEQTVSDRILHQLSVTSYDFVIDLDLKRDRYTVLTHGKDLGSMPLQGCHSARIANMYQSGIVPKDRERYARALAPEEICRRLREEGPYTFSYSITDETGDIRTKNMTVSAVDLRLGRVCLVRTDITASLREQQGLLNAIAYTFDLLGLIDVQSGRLTVHTRQTVLENLSPYVLEHFDSAVERFTDQYGTGEDTEEALSQFQLETILRRLAEKPAGYDFIFPYQAGDGLRYKQINVLWGDENHTTVCLVRADVTDMLAAERQTKKTLEQALALARKANQAKSDFLSAMSHDIRTPMNAIIGMTTLAEAHLEDRARVEDCLRKISSSSKHLLRLINDILDMSKIERAKVTLNLMNLSLSELIGQLCAMVAPQAEEAGVRFLTRTEGIRRDVFYGDGLRISQVLLNLLSNAVKFTPAGGQVELLVEELPPKKQGAYVRYRYTVSDTGSGMPPEFLEHLFEPFSRGMSASRIEGTGLGLSIAKGLVDLMEGEITVESRVNRGSTFRVELECEAPHTGEDGVAEKAAGIRRGAWKPDMLRGRCFLVAEDNAINAEILCDLLALYGGRCVVQTDGARAVQTFREAAPGTYDAVLMDIQMPEMNGYDAARAIRGMDRPDAGDIPIIAMTANAFVEDIQAALDAGMNAHVAKPIDLDVLLHTLGGVLDCGGEEPAE